MHDCLLEVLTPRNSPVSALLQPRMKILIPDDTLIVIFYVLHLLSLGIKLLFSEFKVFNF